MSTVNDLHHQAMDFVDQAMLEQRGGNAEGATKLFEKATEYELAAIEAMEEPVEPTYSVLHRSAASMAMNANQLRQAEQIIYKALLQEPHPEIAHEMREVLEQIYFQRNLERNGVALEGDSMELSLAGPAVGLGIATLNEVFGRVNDAIKLIVRTAERKRGIQFRESGQPDRNIRERFQPWISMPQAGSFSMSLQFGTSPEQLSLSGLSNTSEVIGEFMDLMEALSKSDISEVQERIPEPIYLSNFLGLAKRLAPDGTKIRRVGLTSTGRGTYRSVIITRIASEMPVLSSTEPASEPVEVRGRLLFPDAIRGNRKRKRRRDRAEHNTIKIIGSNGKTHIIRVPPGMMDDIVRPMWDMPVSVRGHRVGKVIVLQDIREVVEPLEDSG